MSLKTTSGGFLTNTFLLSVINLIRPKINNNLAGIKLFSIFIIFGILVFSRANICLAAPSTEDLRNYLTAQAEFADDELSGLNNGEAVTKLLPSPDKREVDVFGIIPIKMTPELGLKTFQETMARQNKKSIIEMGNFSSNPVIEDLRNLTLETGDIQDLRECRVGNCGLQLSEAMITRFQKEIDWNAPDYATQANILFRQMILEYVQNYLARGNSALMEYKAQSEAINLEKEQSSLLRKLMWVNDYAPEFSKYLQNPIRSEPPNTRKSISWTKVKFGLKPVIVITQTITYTGEDNGISQILSVSKQLYASRYFDSSLGLTAIINFPETEDAQNSYLMYINQSRSSSLDGALSKFKHGIVEHQAIEKLKPMLQDTKAFGEASLKNQNVSMDISGNEEIIEWLSEHHKLVWLVVLIGVFVSILGVGKRFAK